MSHNNNIEHLLNKHEVFLFDMDGTLVQSEHLHQLCKYEAFEELYPNHFNHHFDGTGLGDDIYFKQLILKLYPKTQQNKLNQDVMHLVESKRKIFLKTLEEATYSGGPLTFHPQYQSLLKSLDHLANDQEDFIVQGAIQLLELLKSRNKKVALVTVALEDEVNSIMKLTGLKKYFDLIVTVKDHYGVKPIPSGYLSAMRQLGGMTSTTCIFEDSSHGLLAAKRTSAKVFGINSKQKHFDHVLFFKDYQQFMTEKSF